jgi:hypothetical protein
VLSPMWSMKLLGCANCYWSSTLLLAISTCLPTPFNISMKHVDTDLHFVREQVSLSDVHILYVSTT